MFCLLNAFCCVRTDKNSAGTNRFLNIFLLEFNHAGQLASLLLQLITFDHTRLIYQPANESNYLIFTHMLNGASLTTRHDLQLNDFDVSCRASESATSNSEKVANNFISHLVDSRANTSNDDMALNDKIIFQRVLDSFKALNFEENEIKSILTILAAIIHLNLAGACKLASSNVASANQGSNRAGQFRSPNDAHKAANLLGISYNQLNDAIFSLIQSASGSDLVGNGANKNKYSHLSNNGSSRVSPDTVSLVNLTPIECVQGFCMGLYQECLNLIVNCINRTFKPLANQNHAICNSMLLIDPPGFRGQSSTHDSPLEYSDLMCNYMSERLQLMFYQINFITPIEKCAQEGLDNSDLVEHIPESPSSLVNWLDRPPAPNSILNRLSTLSSVDTNCGLLWLLEEQIFNNEIKTAQQFLSKIAESDPRQNFLTLDKQSDSFTIYHQFGQFPIEYNLNTWLENYNKEFVTQRNALTLLQLSRKEAISQTFINSSAMSNAAAALNTAFNNSNTPGSSVNVSAQNHLVASMSGYFESGSSNGASATSLKRQASVRKMLTLSKRKSFIINFKLQIDSVFDSIRKTKPNFVFCMLPDKDIPNFDLREFLDEINVPFVRSQLKAYQLLAACRIFRQGKLYFKLRKLI
jgi:myosin heavy subunit